MAKYGVYEEDTGIVWRINPQTKENAKKEAKLCGPGHRAVRLKLGYQLHEAFTKGYGEGSHDSR